MGGGGRGGRGGGAGGFRGVGGGRAPGRPLRAVQSLPDEDVLRIAVWHHPIQSGEDSRIRDTGFLERLAQAGFRLGLHGHMHQSQEALYRYDMTAAGRRLDLCGAGTFGAPTREWVAGYPKQYQVIELGGDKAKVRTRRMENPNGTWKPDARWTSGPGGAPMEFTPSISDRRLHHGSD